MEKNMYNSSYIDLPIFDCHTHVMNEIDGIEKLVHIKDSFKFDRMNVLSIPSMGDINQNLKCMLYKALYKGKVYAFGGLIHPKDGVFEDGFSFHEQAKRLVELGFEGMKMIEGKTEIRKELGSLDSTDYDEFYRYMEEEKLPILFHVADPETFWDINAIPEWAYKNGWFYGDGKYPEKETIYKEIDSILTKFPKLNIIFAHFYFMSADIDRAADFLDRWSNVSFDLTPGTEMFENFSKYPEKWRDFFIKYQDRILFGTDNYDYASDEELNNMIITVNLLRSFLEKDGEFKAWDNTFKGIGLSRDILEKIYITNFERYAGKNAKKLDINLALKECELTYELALKHSESKEAIDELNKIKSMLKNMED